MQTRTQISSVAVNRSFLKRARRYAAIALVALGALQQPAFAQDAEVPVATVAVNINTADAQTIADALQGVGLSKAKAIIAYREANGEFASIEGLSAVKGIGDATVSKNRNLMTIK